METAHLATRVKVCVKTVSLTVALAVLVSPHHWGEGGACCHFGGNTFSGVRIRRCALKWNLIVVKIYLGLSTTTKKLQNSNKKVLI